MFRANDKDGNAIYIDNAVRGHEYFCPACNSPLILRLGEKRIHHFAHVAGSHQCSDTWKYEMSEWHKAWQERFPEITREVYLRKEKEIHRADVFTGETVIEFQHSRLSIKEFRERNSFYKSFGFNVVWVFDFSSDAKKNSRKGAYYEAYSLRSPLGELDLPLGEDATVYVETNKAENGTLERVKKVYERENSVIIITDTENAVSTQDFVSAFEENMEELKGLIVRPKKAAHFLGAAEGKTIDELWDETYESMIVRDLSRPSEYNICFKGKGGFLRKKHAGTSEVVFGQIIDKNNGRQVLPWKSVGIRRCKEPVWELISYEKRDMTNPTILGQAAANYRRNKLVYKSPEIYVPEAKAIRCIVCGNEYPDSHFASYGGEYGRGKGICKDCRGKGHSEKP